MARPVRIDVAGGCYHVTNRGNERRAIFRDDRDRVRFLELLERAVERFGWRVLAYVLMDNHFHLLVQTPQANLSPAMQWVQVAYTIWFNRRHRRAGHLFQGRFKAVLVELESAAWELSRYMHLNPVRVQRLGLDKAAQQRQRAGMSGPPAAAQIQERLKRLGQYAWSSYPAYSGRQKSPRWLSREVVLTLGGAGSRAQRGEAYRRYVEDAIREGLSESPWERLEAGLLLGGREFVERMRRRARGDAREQPALGRLQKRPSFEMIVAVVEKVKGERWEGFRDRYGDWGRDMVLHLGRRRGGLTLRELARRVGGVDYSSVAKAERRFGEQARCTAKLQSLVARVEKELSNVQT